MRTRTAMAPMTRCFADDQTGVVGSDVVEYYRKRAADGIGLIITEGTVISPQGKGNPGIPGLYSLEQIAAWKKVTEAVHAEGGTIIAQIWHVGRLTHHELTGGLSPQAPSAMLQTLFFLKNHLLSGLSRGVKFIMKYPMIRIKMTSE
ncbi:2,4-dienoyl-CoA reductase-like NADH-dependent reductase (Old Yellow Enzyme family) [Neobacillus sp. B4I6]